MLGSLGCSKVHVGVEKSVHEGSLDGVDSSRLLISAGRWLEDAKVLRAEASKIAADRVSPSVDQVALQIKQLLVTKMALFGLLETAFHVELDGRVFQIGV